MRAIADAETGFLAATTAAYLYSYYYSAAVVLAADGVTNAAKEADSDLAEIGAG